MREIIENFINNEDRTDIPLQVHPLYVYFKILEDNGFVMEDLEENVFGFEADFYYGFTKEDVELEIQGSLWSGGYKLYKRQI